MIKHTALTISLCITFASASLLAHTVDPIEGDVEASGDGYIVVGDNVLKTGLGGCTHSGTFADDSAINVCEGIEDDAEAEPEAVAEAEPEVKAPEPTPLKSRIDTREFSDMALFEFDSGDLNASGTEAMEGLVGKVAEYKGVTAITVTGHTDNVGDADYNMALSEKRAATIADMLAQHYPDAAINIVGKGEAEPVADNATADGRQMNRRVEVELTATRMTFE